MKKQNPIIGVLPGLGVVLLFGAISVLAFTGTLRNWFSPPPPTDTIVVSVGGESITLADINGRNQFVEATRRAQYIHDPLFRQYFLMEKQTDVPVTYDAGANDGGDVKKFYQREILQPLVYDKLILLKASELKLYPLSESDQAAVNVLAHQFYQSYTTFCKESGVTEEALMKRFTLIKTAKLLMDHVTEEITAPEENVRTAYDQLLDYEKKLFAANPSYYDHMLSGKWGYMLNVTYPEDYSGLTPEQVDTMPEMLKNESIDAVITYRPEGYKLIQHLLVPFRRDLQTEVKERMKKENADLLEESINVYKDLGLEAGEVLAMAQAGADFKDLMMPLLADSPEVFTPDTTMFMNTEIQYGPGSGRLNQNISELSMIGDMSGLILTDLGFHIIKWVGNVPAGPVPYTEVRDQIEAALLYDERAKAWAAALAQWAEEAKPELFPDKLQEVLNPLY